MVVVGALHNSDVTRFPEEEETHHSTSEIRGFIVALVSSIILTFGYSWKMLADIHVVVFFSGPYSLCVPNTVGGVLWIMLMVITVVMCRDLYEVQKLNERKMD